MSERTREVLKNASKISLYVQIENRIIDEIIKTNEMQLPQNILNRLNDIHDEIWRDLDLMIHFTGYYREDERDFIMVSEHGKTHYGPKRIQYCC